MTPILSWLESNARLRFPGQSPTLSLMEKAATHDGVETARRTLPPAEQEVLRVLSQGDRRAAVSILMKMYGRSIYRYCCQMLRAEDVAEDVLQITFLQTYQDLDRFSQRSSLRSWLYKIAHNRCLDMLKKDRRREKRINLVEDLAEEPDHGKGPEDRLADQEVSKVVEHCMGELSPEVRTAVLLRFQEGLSYPEMVQICGERPATLQARVARALPVLRRCVEKQGLTP